MAASRTESDSFLRDLPGPVKAVGGLLVAMWAIEVVDSLLLGSSLQAHGIDPRTWDSLEGIVLAPFLHDDWGHIGANTAPFAVLGLLVTLRGLGTFTKVTALVVLLGGAATWLFARGGTGQNLVHIGASGLIFGYLGFLLAAGLFERSLQAIAVAGLVGFLYGGLLWGVLPGQHHVSWEGHLFGFLAGVFAAWRLTAPRAERSGRTVASSRAS